jgi:hypothetical protein
MPGVQPILRTPFPVGTGSATVRRIIDAGNRRAGWLSANTNQQETGRSTDRPPVLTDRCCNMIYPAAGPINDSLTPWEGGLRVGQPDLLTH